MELTDTYTGCPGSFLFSCHDTNPRFGARRPSWAQPHSTLLRARDFGRLTGRVRTSQRRCFWLLPLRLLRTDRGITSVVSLLVTSPLLSGSLVVRALSINT